jgi:hypothetical protein
VIFDENQLIFYVKMLTILPLRAFNPILEGAMLQSGTIVVNLKKNDEKV